MPEVIARNSWGEGPGLSLRRRGSFLFASLAFGHRNVPFGGSGGKGGRGAPGKTPVLGIKERGGDMVAMVVPDFKADTIRQVLNDNVLLDAELLVTDELPSYKPAAKGRRHAIVTHARTFVNSNVHVMGVESFWSLFKRAIIGVYHRVSAKYLQAYLNEFVFRFNNHRHPNLFDLVLSGSQI